MLSKDMSTMKGKLRYINLLRLVGYPIGLGLTSVLVGGTLNRVMIVELRLPASLVGLFFAIPLLISPLRIWLGYRSDGYTLWGLRREPYVVLGSLLAGMGVVAATGLALGNPATLLVMAGILLAMGVHHLGRNLASNTFEALLTDTFTGHRRTQAMTGFKIAMFVGIMGGAMGLGRMMETYSAARLMGVVTGGAALSFILSWAATARQEPRTAAQSAAAERARETPFWRALRTVVLSDPQVRRFFVCMVLIMVGTQAQDVILEPFGALVLGMTVGETTRLTALWGAGTVLAMAVAGMWLIKLVGYAPVTRAGLWINAGVFAGLIFSGWLGHIALFQGLVFALGVGTGLASAGLLSAVVHFATAVRAGLLMSVWGLTHNLGQAMGSVLSGSAVDGITRLAGGDALAAYGAVFAVEGALLLAGWWLFERVNVAASAAATEAGKPAGAHRVTTWAVQQGGD
jgi:BCD family chlorophyll transporter-like MFS transporter